MYAFGMIALLGLAVLVLARVANRYMTLASEVWAFALVALGVGAAWLIAVAALAGGGQVETLTDPPAGIAARLRFPLAIPAGLMTPRPHDPAENGRNAA